MQTGGISSQDQWARFMQLSSAARLRNQGLVTASGGSKRPVPARPRASVQGAGAASLPLRAGSTVHRAYAPTPAVKPERILGGAFDAYA